MPTGCANCGAPATARHPEKVGHSTLAIPTCSRCLGLRLQLGTLRLAASLSAIVAAGVLLLTLPRLLPNLDRLDYILWATVPTFFPALVVWLLRRRPPEDCTSGAAAVWAHGGDQLRCTSRVWATQLSDLNQAPLTVLNGRTPVLTVGLFAGAVAAGVAAPVVYDLLHPKVVALNLDASEFTLLVDGREVGVVEASSLESPRAGFRFRAGVGQRRFDAVTPDGQVLATAEPRLEAGQTYLYAPLSEDFCFWLETADYGRGNSESETIELDRRREFWRLPKHVDNWFFANPIPPSDRRSSGGQLTALRHARCADRSIDLLEQADD